MSSSNYLSVIAISLLLYTFVGSAKAQISGTTPSPDPSYQPFFVTNVHEEENSQTAQGRIPEERGCGAGSLSWSANDSIEIPGIYWANLKTYCRDGVEITIWTDFESSFFGGSDRAKSNGRMIVDGDSFQGGNGSNRIISGMLEANAKINYEFEVFSSDDGIGFINEFEFNLQNGGLFLVASNGSDIEIKQVHYNTAGISAQDLKLLAIRHEEIRTFFENYHQ
jgi:hypothetical protein